jgi:phosphopentomutase
VLNNRRVKIDTNDDSARIYSGCIGENGSWEVERRENVITQQKAVVDATGIGVQPNAVTFGVSSSNKCKNSSRKVNRGERPLVEPVSVTHSATIRVRTEDHSRRGNSNRKAADRSGGIETGEDAVLGHYKTVGSTA